MTPTGKPSYWWCNTGGSDKVYAVFFHSNGATAVWGRRGGTLKSTEYSTTQARDKIADRRRKDYLEVHEADGVREAAIIRDINRVAGYNPSGTPSTPVTPVPPPTPAIPTYTPDRPGVVICLDNTGKESFTVGVDYLLKGITPGGFLLVEDMYGVDWEVMPQRFKITDERPVLA